MSSPTVEALVARCLTDPAFLKAAIRDRTATFEALPSEVRKVAQDLDLEKLWRFSGFIGKVQHNYLWEYFPATRHLLWQCHLEHEVFGLYREVQLEPLHKLSGRQERVARFVEFLGQFLSEDPQPAINSVFGHERLLWDLRTDPQDRTCDPGGVERPDEVSWRSFLRLVPKLPANVRVVRFALDPIRLIDRLSKAPQTRLTLSGKPVTLVYVMEHPSALKTLALDSVSGAVLGCVNGRRQVGTIISRVRRAGLSEVQPLAFRGVFEGAVAAKLVVMKEAEGACA